MALQRNSPRWIYRLADAGEALGGLHRRGLRRRSASHHGRHCTLSQEPQNRWNLEASRPAQSSAQRWSCKVEKHLHRLPCVIRVQSWPSIHALH